ncbi:FeS cluster assembly protein SufD [Brevundimonas sp. SH203]|uniref:Fe-S cluster assembly protein SufD n=1 Tax=Brevundimonas sp. SH203 TaxID=345167 RepID=UPI0009C48348|nr:Fe-S cluster assembly protein SufD [Brevundimonas sp. SH203]GAW41011.1 FeS cluster assembly protein SufD [Brevundimonas sp. SH203]
MSAPIRIDLKAIETIPSRRTEAWKYSDLRRWVRDEPPLSPALLQGEPNDGPFNTLTTNEVLIANGRLNWWSEDSLEAGVEVVRHAGPDAPRMADEMPMGALAAAKALEGVCIISFKAGEPRSIALRLLSDAVKTGHHARIGLLVEAGAHATVLESHEGWGEAYLSNTLIEFLVDEGATLERIVLIEEPHDAISVTSAEVHLSKNATYRQTIVATGARLQRLETRIAHAGEGATVRMDGLYVLNGERHVDLTSVVDHRGPDGATSQLIKGVARDTARGVFQGKIVVERGADGTDARMGHHALIASERAEIDAKPELIIYADDVQCAHGNTVGTLDESALFYMQQRGIPAEEARALLTQAFLIEVIDRIEHEGAREVAREWLTARL